MKFSEFKALDKWEQVRTITGIIPQTGDIDRDNRILISRLATVCLISRVVAGDADQEFLDEQLAKMFPKED